MAEVTVTRHVDADPEAVRAAMADIEWFMLAAEFTDVTVEDEAGDAPDDRAQPGDVVTVENRVGLATLTLTVELVDDPDAALAYVQADGMFDAMTTRYTLAAGNGGTEVTAWTEFSLGDNVAASALDATLVSRQRRSELTAQLDALVERFGDGGGEH
jgi:hypothetical protein